jgi:hypothetical protein
MRRCAGEGDDVNGSAQWVAGSFGGFSACAWVVVAIAAAPVAGCASSTPGGGAVAGASGCSDSCSGDRCTDDGRFQRCVTLSSGCRHAAAPEPCPAGQNCTPGDTVCRTKAPGNSPPVQLPDKGAPCSACAKDGDCGPGLACHQAVFVCKSPSEILGDKPACDADCKATPACKQRGHCLVAGGECVKDRCLKDPACSASGLCTTGNDGKCTAANDEDCKASTACKVLAKCVAKDGACVVNEDPKCKSGQYFKCLDDDTLEYCATTKALVQEECASVCTGKVPVGCMASPAKGHDVCYCADKKSDSECAVSTKCKAWGYCKANGSECGAPSGGGCKDPCKSYGDCTAKGGWCTATSDGDCKASLGCSMVGFCTLAKGKCSATGASDCSYGTTGGACAWQGLCKFKQGEGIGECVPGAEADCQKAYKCRQAGWCSIDGDACGTKSCTSSLQCPLGQSCGGVCYPFGGTYTVTIEDASVGMKDKTGAWWDASNNPPDVYVLVYVDGKVVAKTEYVSDSANPVWNKTFQLAIKPGQALKIELWDSDLLFADLMAEVEYSNPAKALLQALGDGVSGPIAAGSAITLQWSAGVK